MSITESKDIINIYKLDPLIKTLFEGLEEELPEDIFKHGGPDPVRKNVRVPERELLVSPLAEHVCDVPQGRPQVPPFLLLSTILLLERLERRLAESWPGIGTRLMENNSSREYDFYRKNGPSMN